MKVVALALALAACHAKPPAAWPVPAGYKSETIAFPLPFATSIRHTGVEELRFPPGFLDQTSPNHWSYAFLWKLTDPAAATLDAAALSTELTLYFRGLLGEVDGDRHRFDVAAITATATPSGPRFALRAQIFDAFVDAAPIELTGTAERMPCGWMFVLAPPLSPIRPELAVLARCP